MDNLAPSLLKYEKFYSTNSQEIHLLKKSVNYLVFFLVFLSLTILIFFLNIYIFTTDQPHTLKQIFVSFFQTGDQYNSEFDPIHKIIWVNLASIIAAAALCIASAIAQSLTQNSLADATTLGMVDASIFGIVLMKTFFGSFFSGSYYHFLYMFFACIGSLLILFCLIFFMKKQNSQNLLLKIILFGLILNIFFRTAVHIAKTYSVNSVNTIYAITMGGAENVYELFPRQFDVLKIAAIVLFCVFCVAWSLSKQFNLSELGLEQSQSLGVNNKWLRIAGFSIILLSTTIAVTLAGNIAFIGLLSTHVVRYFFKTRKYQIILPISVAFSSVIFLFSVLLHISIPEIPSSIFLLFFGSLSLFYLSIKNKS